MEDSPWEDNLLERKSGNDLRDLLKTLVAFANSVKPEHVAVILIGEKDDGTAVGVWNPDKIQKKIREECDKIYPGIIWRSKHYQKDGVDCIRVEIEYSGDTPHFGGPAWVRKGSETIKATDEVFQRLIDLRSEKVRELSKWLGKTVTVNGDTSNRPKHVDAHARGAWRLLLDGIPRWQGRETTKLVFVNRHWISLEKPDKNRVSEPLDNLMLSFDDKEKRLMIIIPC